MKSKNIVIGAILLSAIAACSDNKYEDKWTDGKGYPKQTDSVFYGRPYRYYYGHWYPIYGGRINPGIYSGASLEQISSPNYQPSLRSGGFGESAHSSGEGAGE